MVFKGPALVPSPTPESSCRAVCDARQRNGVLPGSATSIDAHRGAKPKPMVHQPFPYDPGNKDGSRELSKGIKTQHEMIQKSRAVVSTWEGQDTKEMRHVRSTKPQYKMNAYDQFLHSSKLDLMEKAVNNAASSVDSGFPKEGWNYRKVLTKARQQSLNSKRNIASAAYQRNWSTQVQLEAAKYLGHHKNALEAKSSVGSTKLSNQLSPAQERFQLKMAKCREQGQTIANSKVDGTVPGQGRFDVPADDKHGPHAGPPTGASGGLSHVQKQVQARSSAMQGKNKPKAAMKNMCRNLLEKTGFSADMDRMTMNQTLLTASSPTVQAAYLKSCNNWAPPSPRVNLDELGPLDTAPRPCVVLVSYQSTSESGFGISKGERVYALKPDLSDESNIVVFNNAGCVGSVPVSVLNFSDGPKSLNDAEILEIFERDRENAKVTRSASPTKPKPQRPKSGVGCYRRVETLKQHSNSRSPMADRLFGKRPATAQGFVRKGSIHPAHHQVTTQASLSTRKRGTPRDSWLEFTNSE